MTWIRSLCEPCIVQPPLMLPRHQGSAGPLQRLACAWGGVAVGSRSASRNSTARKRSTVPPPRPATDAVGQKPDRPRRRVKDTRWRRIDSQTGKSRILDMARASIPMTMWCTQRADHSTRPPAAEACGWAVCLPPVCNETANCQPRLSPHSRQFLHVPFESRHRGTEAPQGR